MADLLRDMTLNYWNNMMTGAKVTIDSEQRDYEIHPSSYIEGNVLKKFVYLSTETGHITEAYLHDRDGRRIESQTMSVKKSDNGLMITFYFELDINRGVSVG